jgi:succinate-semialdehyde dehydrogenase/glutarate-semialdehyde dehydrogenase
LVLEDADIERAAVLSAQGRLVNSGQNCIAAKRFMQLRKCAPGSKSCWSSRCEP